MGRKDKIEINISDIDLLREIKELTAKGVGLNFYNCDKHHLHHTIPYEAEYLNDVVIRIYSDSTKMDIKTQIFEAKRNVVNLIKKNEDKFDTSEYPSIYKYLYQHLNFTERDVDFLKKSM